MTASNIAAAQVTPTTPTTQVYNAPNGVPVVDIANPNANGLSHNQYTDYNVTSKGLILNNGDISQFSRQSQLAGQVMANMNLTKEATVILNEVTSTNRSTLAGYTEVLGGAADVLVANPNGITCNGCGFINAPNVTLTTGVPQITGGNLTGFRIEQGDILITGNGLDATKQDYLALLARAIKLDAQLNAKGVDVVAGANDWDYVAKTAAARAGTGAAPTLAIDSSALGGMYVNRIRLIATEAGVGVKMLGEAAAGSGDFTLTSSGKIELGNAISASHDVHITTDASGADAIKATDARISATNDTTLESDNGITLLGGSLMAGHDLTLHSFSLSDDKTTNGAYADNNKRYGAHDLVLTQTGAQSLLGGVYYGAAHSLTGTAGSLTVGAGGATFYSSDALSLTATNAMSLGTVAMKSLGNLTLQSTNGALTLASGGNVQSTAGNALLKSGNGFTNNGNVSADAGSLTVRVNGTLTNSATGVLNAGTTLDVGDYTGSYTETVNNSNKMLAGTGLTLNSATLTNNSTGVIQGGSAYTAYMRNSLTNDGEMKLYNTGHTGTSTVTVYNNNISNTGLIYSSGTLTALAGGNITNSGGMAAYGTANITTSTGGISNSGTFYAGTLLNVTAATSATNTSSGTMNGGTDISVTAQTFTNNNDIIAGRNLTITASSAIYNEIPGGDQRVWNYSTASQSDTGWGSDPAWLLWGQNTSKYYTRTWYEYQTYTGGTPAASAKPRLIANTTLTIGGAYTYAHNLGGIISAPDVWISSTNGGAVFTNDAYNLTTNYYKETWNDYVSCCSGTFATDLDYYYGQNDVTALDPAHPSTATTFGAGIYAGTMHITGFTLTNAGSVVAATPASTPGSSTGFGGITITPPTNPNGYFVVSKNPNSQYLIETNPLYGEGSSLSSQYMIDRLGLDPDMVQKRLGDGGYEASLIRDQLTAQTGATILINGETEAQQMQRLMDNGVDEGKKMGLTFGKAPTAEQIANLKTDMVWMVETEVMGQKVLAPVVYLSAATKAAITTGAVIAGNDIHMDVKGLNNTGGTIAGSKSVDITSQGDIKNLSGNINSGGDMNLKSTEGSIVNETYAKTMGNDENAGTTIGATAGISAKGNLSLDAKKDITNKGANVEAGGDASLKAGENITFDTIEDTKAETTHTHSGNSLINGTSETHTTGSTKNIGSNLKVGGNLKTDSGKDTTLRGSNVDVGGDADIHAGGDLNVLDAQDKTYTKDKVEHSGAGVGGGVYGTETTDDSHTKKTSVGSKINVGGNAKLSTENKLKVQGSDITSGGDMELNAKDVEVLEGRNEETTTHSKTTTTFLKVEDSESSSDSDSGSSSSSSAEGDKAGADAEAHASAEANGSGGVTAMSTETNTSTNYKNTGKASNIKSGGNMKIESKNDTLIRGSNVEAGGDVELKGNNINIEASEDIDTTTTTHSKTSIGLYGDSKNKAEASADAGAHADGGGASANADKHGAGYNAGDANADAGAHAKAEASSNNTLDVMRTTKSDSTTTDVTHQGASIKSGGNMKVTADKNLNVVGSDMEAGGDVDLKAKDMSFTAAQDSHTTTKHSSTTSVGLYADAEADASADADVQGQANNGHGSASAGAEANASAGIGLQGTNTTDSSTDGSTHARTSTIKSGGNMTRKADNKITDEGTQIEAGGDFTQESKEWESKAAKDTTFSSSDSETNTAKAGLYAEGSASAKAGADSYSGTENESGADASAGVKASYERNTASESSSSSKAVTGSIKSGGNMKTTTTGKTSLEGTNLESGGDMELNADSLDYKAAHDTSTSSKNSSKINGEVKVGVDATKAVTGSLSGGYDADRSTDTSDHAVVGGMKSGGNMKVNTKNDAHFEGTNLEAGGDASVKAGGNLTFDAAHDKESHTGSSENASASISASKSKGGGADSKGAGLEAKGGFTNESSSSDTAVTGGIKSGGKMDLSAGKNATFTGTALESGGDMNVDAKGDVNFNAAKSTSTSESYGAEVGIKASKGGKEDGKKKGSSAGIEAEGNYNKEDSTTSTAGSLKSGGKVNVKSGNDVNLEGTSIESTGKTTLDAKHDVNFKAAEDTSSSIGVEASLSGEKKKAAAGEDKKDDGTSGGGSFGVKGGTSSTKKGGSIKAGEIDIKAGNDATLEGTSLESDGDTSLKAGHDINLKAAESSHVEGNIGAGGTSDGVGMGGANIGGGVQKDGVQIKSGGNLKMDSGNDTTMEGTKAKVEGKADIKAGGDIKKKSTVSGGGAIGTTSAGVSLDVEDTEIDAKGGETDSH